MDIHRKQSLPFYSSIQEKEEYFSIKQINTLVELINEIESLNEEGHIYRGVNDSSYKMLSSYHRLLHTGEYKCEDERSIGDSQFLEEQYKNLSNNSSFIEDAMEIADSYNITDEGEYRIDGALNRYLFTCSSTLQHYENISFLLDFTSDPYVGLFFSTYQHSEADFISLIYFPVSLIEHLNLESEDDFIEVYSSRDEFHKYLTDSDYVIRRLKNLATHFLTDSRPLVLESYNRYILNDRQEKQKGCFVLYKPNTLCGPSESALEEVIISKFDNPKNKGRVKPTSIEIPRNLIPEINSFLRSIQISKKSLGL